MSAFDPRTVAGVKLLLARRWFDAHESLEDVWRELDQFDERRGPMQAIIQHAVALEHLQRGNALGAFNVWSKAKAKPAPDWFEGIGLGPWADALAAFYGVIDLGNRVRQQLEGGVAAGAEHLDLPPLPPAERWPVPPLSDDLAAACK